MALCRKAGRQVIDPSLYTIHHIVLQQTKFVELTHPNQTEKEEEEKILRKMAFQLNVVRAIQIEMLFVFSVYVAVLSPRIALSFSRNMFL